MSYFDGHYEVDWIDVKKGQKKSVQSLNTTRLFTPKTKTEPRPCPSRALLVMLLAARCDRDGLESHVYPAADWSSWRRPPHEPFLCYGFLLTFLYRYDILILCLIYFAF